MSNFTQQKDEWVAKFYDGQQLIYLIAHLSPSFAAMDLTDKFHRAKRNSVDIFSEIDGAVVTDAYVTPQDRSFVIALGTHYALLVKLYGSMSNIILFGEQKPIKLFRTHFTKDLAAALPAPGASVVEMPPPETLAMARNRYQTLGKDAFFYLEKHGYDTQKPDIQKNIWGDFMHLLLTPNFYIAEANQKIKLTLFPTENPLQTFEQPLPALHAFYTMHHRHASIHSLKQNATQQLTERITKTQRYLDTVIDKKQFLENDAMHRRWADLIMANLSRIPPGAAAVNLEDFYRQDAVAITLNPQLTSQQNAARYYQKAKNKKIEIAHLVKIIEQKQNALQMLQRELENIAATEDFDVLKKQYAPQCEKSKQKPSLPFHEIEFQGCKILIGKNAEANDKLTLHYASKEDYWLHARDVSGSHVVIKSPSKQAVTKSVIERAAALAAYYSKRKNDTLCPVTVTQRKYLVKRKNDPPGTVRVLRETVILVKPER